MRDFCSSSPSSLSQFGNFTTGVKTGITVLKYCIYNLFITQFIRQKERSDDLRLAIWVPKCSKLNPLNCTGPYLLPIKAWHDWAIKWHLLKLRISCSERSGDSQMKWVKWKYTWIFHISSSIGPVTKWPCLQEGFAEFALFISSSLSVFIQDFSFLRLVRNANTPFLLCHSPFNFHIATKYFEIPILVTCLPS